MKKIILAILLTVALVLGLSSCYPSNTVVVFGDSLVVNSTAALKADRPGIIVNAYGGTAVCQWSQQMKAAADNNPQIVIASFVGNGSTDNCGGQIGSKYYWDAMFLTVVDISRYYASRHVQLRWAAYPVRGFPSIYTIDWAKVQSMYQWAAADQPAYVKWFDAGLTVAPNHVYTESINGRAVRQPDKLHLTEYGGELYARELLKTTM